MFIFTSQLSIITFQHKELLIRSIVVTLRNPWGIGIIFTRSFSSENVFSVSLPQKTSTNYILKNTLED